LEIFLWCTTGSRLSVTYHIHHASATLVTDKVPHRVQNYHTHALNHQWLLSAVPHETSLRSHLQPVSDIA